MDSINHHRAQCGMFDLSLAASHPGSASQPIPEHWMSIGKQLVRAQSVHLVDEGLRHWKAHCKLVHVASDTQQAEHALEKPSFATQRRMQAVPDSRHDTAQPCTSPCRLSNVLHTVAWSLRLAQTSDGSADGRETGGADGGFDRGANCEELEESCSRKVTATATATITHKMTLTVRAMRRTRRVHGHL
eukprot:CAMPEP_0119334476 /NCGR_PEP_ID=MMETSP1333-20130426/87423_1 /TAXON_ID=418940 /ORGANISM="Scyphosphaera apsteinii, Strain RCC1455" /LENGTH=187 /DNA_ID=CAMNT_0007344777 /DNA_START=157 /DNA_END=720 /DNA_ORIENTATION=+